MTAAIDSLDIQTLSAGYAAGRWSPSEVIDTVLERIANYPDKAVWIDLFPRELIEAQLDQATQRRRRGIDQPLFGIPFAVKDNIDVAGRPTTAACPEFAYVPEKSATVVTRLCAAGAVLVGKTNLDQFATGLVGIRTPYGPCHNAFDPKYIAGGSSGGSAVAVAAGLVSFALGTDTAGSGRVPAAFNNLVGLKPTRGLLSTAGVLPACRSLDCVSIFALTCEDAARIMGTAKGYDEADIYSRQPEDLPPPRKINPGAFRFGVPAPEHLRFFGNKDAEQLYQQGVERMRSVGGMATTIDFDLFAEAAELLYDGPWLAERKAALMDFVRLRPEALHPVIRQILGGAEQYDAVAAFDGIYHLQALRQRARAEWARMDLILLPSTGTIYTIEEVEAEPLALNSNLGYYTNFVNLMDLCAVAVPNGFQPNGLPVGLTLVGPAGCEDPLLSIASAYHQSLGATMGATGRPLPPRAKPDRMPGGVRLAVVGAHLSGQPLNWQLTERGARLVRSCRTSPSYRLFALPGTTPPKPGLLRVEDRTGSPIDVEVWEMSHESFGSFVAAIPPPLGVGTIQLEDGELVKSFLCESYAVANALDISHFGGWRQYLFDSAASQQLAETAHR